ncbi:transcriptional regulator [Candidatus Latescibacterota bacterium]
MKIKDILVELEAEQVWATNCPGYENCEVNACHASDQISDVLTFHGEGSLLLTGLTNSQVIRTAEILDFVAICFVRGKIPQPDTIKLAEVKGIMMFATPYSMYTACGRLYAKGIPAGRPKKGDE